MKIEEIIEKAEKAIASATKLPVKTVISVSKEKEKMWKVRVEIVEMKRIPESMDMLGVYDVYVDDKGELDRFERKLIRRRGDTDTGEVM